MCKTEIYSKFYLITFLIVCLSLVSVNGQESNARISDLEHDFKMFEYQKVLDKGSFLLADAFITKNDSMQILTYMLNAAYALNDTTNARAFIETILKADSNHNLDPRDNSPKIIEFYNYIKEQAIVYPTKNQNELDDNNKQQTRRLSALPFVTTLAFPGSGHIINKDYKKGYIYSSISAVLLSGIIITAIKTDDYHARYFNAQDGNFSKLYDDYNSVYKTRNILIGAYLALSLYSLFDLAQSQIIVIPEIKQSQNLSLNINYSF